MSETPNSAAHVLTEDDLDEVGKLMFAAARIMACAGIRITEEYLGRLLSHRKTPEV